MSDFVVIASKFRWVRSVVGFCERNHLIGRSREDIFYHTRPFLPEYEVDSVLSCFDRNHRLPVRPENFVRRWLFDRRRLRRPVFTPIRRNLEIRNTFRNISEAEILRRVAAAQTAPGNNHAHNAATRNAASSLLSCKNWPHNFKKFSLSGARPEMMAAGNGYRGLHQASDFAQQPRRDNVLRMAPELEPQLTDPAAFELQNLLCREWALNPDIDLRDRWFVLSTDTTNHLPLVERNAILANGIPILSYSPTPVSERELNADRITYWEGNKLVTKVNGGGNYVDSFTNTALDVEVIDCPDGDIMLVYYDCFRDPLDVTHAYIAQTPFAKVARYSSAYRTFLEYPRPHTLSPYTITSDTLTYSCLGVRHNNLIQITDNAARMTRYYKRSELLACAGETSKYKVQARLRQKPPVIFGVETDDLERAEILHRIGYIKLVSICTLSPEFNMSNPPRESRFSATVDVLMQLTNKDKLCFDKAYKEAPQDVQRMVRRILGDDRVPNLTRNVATNTEHEGPPGFENVAI